ncbi:MAG: amidase [Pseudomonadota bacterium]
MSDAAGWTAVLTEQGVAAADVAVAKASAEEMARQIGALASDPTAGIDLAAFQALLRAEAGATASPTAEPSTPASPAPASPTPAGGAAVASIETMARDLARGAVSAVELTEHCLAALRRAGETLNAVARLEPEAALDQARAADARLAICRRDGETAPPLLGIPLAHKDLYARAGWLLEAGSAILRGNRATTTATAITALDRAGAVDLGRLNTVEFALGPDGRNAHTGPVRNPWDTARVTGGSSSGSGAAVAAGAVPGALGSDTGGSIRLPAAACGVVGIKPTAGLIGRTGIWPLSGALDTAGPLAATVRDAALMVQAMAGHDPGDPQSVDRPPVDLMAGIEDGLRGLRVGIAEQPFLDGVDEEVARAFADALTLMSAEGATTKRVSLPGIETANLLNVAMINAEAAAQHRAWLATRAGDYGNETLVRILSGLFLPSTAYLAAAHGRAPLLRAALAGPFAEVDVIATPVWPFDPPLIEDDDPAAYRARTRLIGQGTRPFNYLGLPAVVLPAALSARGLPIALQLVGRPYEEALVLRAARGVERARAFSAEHRPAIAA